MKALRILLVDDVQDILDVLGILLEMDGYDVTYATSYRDGLAFAEKEAFDLVITDWRMPGMTGLHLLEMIKDIKPNLPVIVMSAYMSHELERELARRGVDGVIQKAFEYPQLSELIERVMEKVRS